MKNIKETSRNGKVKSHVQAFGEHFLKMSPDLMTIIRLDKTVEFFNDAWEKISGYSRTELQEKTIWALLHPDDNIIVEKELKRLTAGETEAVDIELRLVCKNRSIKNISWNANVDQITGLVYGVGRDLTTIYQKNKVLSDSEEKLKFISENTFEAVAIIQEDVIQLVNTAFLKLFGYNNELEIIGKNYYECVAEIEIERVKKIVAKKFEGVYESKCKNVNEDYFPVEINARIITYKNKTARILAIKNIEERKLAQDKIHASELRFRSVFENHTVGILLSNMHGSFVDVNALLLSRLGYEREEFLKLSIKDILHNSELENATQSMHNLLNSVITKTQKERKFVHQDGSIMWLRCTSSLITVDNGEQLLMSMLEDIEEKKKSENALLVSKEKLRAVYEGSPMGILITKQPGIIIDVNPAFEEMIGYEAKELIGKNILEFTHPLDVTKSEKLMNKVYTENVNIYTYEKKYVRKDGTLLWAKTVVSQMNIDPDNMIAVAMIENIENKKQTEEKLEVKNKELLQINQELEHFAYVASHDLQEPLRTITSFIQILDKKYSDKLDEDGQQFMSYVVEGAKRMQSLIKDLLEYSRINRYNTSYETVDLDEVYQTVNRVLNDKILSNDAIFLAENLPVVQGNKVQLTQIFQNLVDNAIKFRGKKKPEITVTVNEHSDKWEFAFTDNGIGISNEYYQRIFVIFQRLHTREDYPGTGIGLSICKKIIERHGGEIWVESKVNKGTTFYFTIAKNLSLPTA
ncbi:MAG: PAS domain S-box protein [Fimbriimonadaceae bacterium]|nr:PAS domain S-box protein [Chitinophagales bacterium]